MEAIKITEIINFLTGSAPYLFLYIGLGCSTLMTIVFGISAFLARRDGTQYEKRLHALDNNKDVVEFFQGLGVKNENTLSVVEKFHTKKEKGVQQLGKLKNISGRQTKSYLIKTAICFTVAVVFLGGLHFFTQADLDAHNLEGKYFIVPPPYDMQSVVYQDGMKKNIVIDSNRSIKYEYVFKDVDGRYELQYADKEIMVPSIISNTFKVVWLLLSLLFTYLMRILAF